MCVDTCIYLHARVNESMPVHTACVCELDSEAVEQL